jgi:hypothetical protein
MYIQTQYDLLATSDSTLRTHSGSIMTAAQKKELLSQNVDTYVTSVSDSGKNVTTTSDTYTNSKFSQIIDQTQSSLYGRMADSKGEIKYNDTTYLYDAKKKEISIGDVSNKDDVISVTLTTGDTLLINRNNIDAVAKSIGLFTPKDVNRILNAIAQDAKAQSKRFEIENDKSKAYDTMLRSVNDK